MTTQQRRRPGPVLRAQPEGAAEYVLEGEGLASTGGRVDPSALRARIIHALRTVRDPELPVNIYDLGLVYAIELDDVGFARVTMTLTAPGCPVAGAVVSEAHDKLRSVPGVMRARTALVWDPPWSPQRLSAAARLELGLV